METGLYEKVINKELQEQLNKIKDLQIEKAPVDRAEAHKILTKYISDIVEKSLVQIGEDSKNEEQVANEVQFVNKLIAVIKGDERFAGLGDVTVPEYAEELLLLLNTKSMTKTFNNKTVYIRPETSLARSSLFTGSHNEPTLESELKKEIATSNRIDILVSFIKWSGLLRILKELKEFTESGYKLRVVTTSYMGATDLKAIEELQKLPNTEIKISYDTKRTRLHAKAYIFHRLTGYDVAYVGSSNLSNVAITSGTEWNTKITAQDLPETIKKVNATFEIYWNSSEFELYDESKREKLRDALTSEGANAPLGSAFSFKFAVNPYPYQQAILDRLKAERELRNSYRNLVVAATGTGKTVIAAFDFRNFLKVRPNAKLLFVAHREEILKQSRDCFRGVLGDPNFGDLYVGGFRPEDIQKTKHLFISVQTLNSQKLTEKLPKDFYDFIIVDETHHAAAKSYLEFLKYFTPKILLGLTATPERMDGEDILEYFNHRIAAEIRLAEAIERKLLSPFQYFGVSDTVDLSTLKWVRGQYDTAELENVLAIDEYQAKKRAAHVFNMVMKYVTDINDVKGLGFCASIKHAEFMNDYFNKECGIPSKCLTGNTSDEVRNSVKEELISGKIKFIFVVDLYNEGVDIPEVNTVLFLRPTESLTIFLQQLGRGLRLADGKECLTVLDFIGQANKKYNFESKFKALLANTRKGIEKEIQSGFCDVPLGCYVELEKIAAEVVLENVKHSLTSRDGLIDRMRTFTEDTNKPLTMNNFVNYYEIHPQRFYVKGDLFTDLKHFAEGGSISSDVLSEEYRKAMYRVSQINSRRWLSFLKKNLPDIATKNLSDFNNAEQRMLRMFYYTFWGSEKSNIDFSEALERIKSLPTQAECFAELQEIFDYNLNTIDFIDEDIVEDKDCPLDLYCSYGIRQIVAAMADDVNPASVRQGVYYFDKAKTDTFFVTLNKSDKDYSPTTMYNDYFISPMQFHWQSQSTTTEQSKTGQRYIHHREMGSKVMLFVREYNNDSNKKAETFTFLGYISYVRHNGSEPMNIVWQMGKPVPAAFLEKTNLIVV